MMFSVLANAVQPSVFAIPWSFAPSLTFHELFLQLIEQQSLGQFSFNGLWSIFQAELLSIALWLVHYQRNYPKTSTLALPISEGPPCVQSPAPQVFSYTIKQARCRANALFLWVFPFQPSSRQLLPILLSTFWGHPTSSLVAPHAALFLPTFAFLSTSTLLPFALFQLSTWGFS